LEHLVNSIDIAPTIVQYAGLEVPAVHQGRSLVPLGNGDPVVPWREDIYCEHVVRSYPNWRMVRDERFKYAVYYENESYECLYDLKEDPEEFVNLATNPKFATTLATLRERLEAYCREFPERKSASAPNGG